MRKGIRTPEITEMEIRHMSLSRSLAGEYMVLLENDGALPVPKETKLALFGNGAVETVKGGTGSGDVNSRTNVSIREGLEQEGYEISTKDWIQRADSRLKQAKADYQAMILKNAAEKGSSIIMESFMNPFRTPELPPITQADLDASDTDTAVYVISRNSGEGADRFAKDGDYYLSEADRIYLKQLTAAYAKVIVILNIGGVMDMKELKETDGISAVLLMTQLGNIGGLALADVLSGAVNPSGKLTDTWAADYQDYPSSETFSHNNGDVDDDDYAEGIYVGYRYFDTKGVQPIYPFGYGKSYTTFTVEPAGAAAENGTVTVCAKVTNTGSRAGKEVVQVYVSAPAGHLDKPAKELKAFVKTGLIRPGESETVKASFAVKDMASYCEDCAAYVLEEGAYIVSLGPSSADVKPAAVLTLDKKVRTLKLKNLFAKDREFAEMHIGTGTTKEQADAAIAAGARQIALKAEDIATESASYATREEYHTDKTEKLTAEDIRSGKCTVEELVAQLTVKELATLCVGTQRAGGTDEVIGNASSGVPGAAGETSPVIEASRGIRRTINADGPAGLRLQPHFRTDPEGKLLPGGAVFGDSVQPFPEMEEGTYTDYYQYCTAIPIGWALAQSWNMELVEQAADMVGKEMEIFGVDMWLAPALNIHRNPLCGRNFEYYSEDPVVSGEVAAAITRGVQSHPGKGTTIKHFACNNQEDNRYFTNVHIGERAMREIYLKGFEICVRKTQPIALMTSYNLINGIHAANCFDLIQCALRDEWGYQGVVMTDWFSSQHLAALTGTGSKYPIASSTGCVKAGNDIQEPGCEENVADLVKSIEEGVPVDGVQITMADLQFNAANVIRAALRCMQG